MNIFGIISFLIGAFTTFIGCVMSYAAKHATSGGWGGPVERYIDYEKLHIANIVTFIGVALIVVGIIFFLIKFINKEPNNKNTVKCLKCGYIANQKEIFCSKCGNDLREQGTMTQLQNIDKS